jgi:hypothetical protein
MPDYYSKAKSLLLSEAIRLGTTLGPQCFEKPRDRERQATCELGAAFQALSTRGDGRASFGTAVSLVLGKEPLSCPHCGGKFQNPFT